ncbi:hypothetical protein O9K51_10944 [Purpureocillium lavendulum]|uniref:Secreted protein n=1 Tax=Purpureocillium lavendulum TaxID=1247861 RepID=A0AB34FBT1_9HYPO|nr:hypothetical protein O9K51_10944 [Purpureocillium lavendulum]
MAKCTSYLVFNKIFRFLRPSSFISWSISILLFADPVFSVIRILGNAVVVEVGRADCGWLMIEQGIPVVLRCLRHSSPKKIVPQQSKCAFFR